MLRKISSLLISLCLIFQQVGFASMATELNLAGHLSKMPSAFVADKFRPVHIRFFSFDAQNDNIKVMLDKGDVKSLKDAQINASTKELLNYFLVGITLPNDKFWVNLRPDSEDNIIDDWLAKTDVGKIMLEADLQLKKDTAQFTSPQTAEGKEYWNRLYKKAEELYGYQEVSIPTLTRPWIVPNEVIVRESKESAYIYKATLKVMLEQDFLKDSSVYNFKDARAKALNEYSSELIRELIIPKLTQEVNLSKRYAPLRQVYYSIVLSRWFKSRFNNQTGKYASRIDRKDLTGLASATAWSKSTYFDAYKKSFAQGEYNIKETVRTPTGQVIRSYFSGGLKLDVVNLNGGRASSAIEQSLLTAGLIRPEGMKVVTSSPVSKVLVLSNIVSLLSGAQTRGYNIMHAISDGANGAIFNHSENRADLEVAMDNMLRAISGLKNNKASEKAIIDTWTKTLKTKGLTEGQIKNTLHWLEAFLNNGKPRNAAKVEVYSRFLTNEIIGLQLRALIDKSKDYKTAQTVLCVGETKDQRNANRTKEVIREDLAMILTGVTTEEAQRIGLRIAYEPRWAIGTGLTPTSNDIQDAHSYIKEQTNAILGLRLGVDYGGSLNSKNAKAILSLPDVDGGLIGGAAKKIEEISVIIQEAITQGKAKNKLLNVGMNWKAENADTGLAPLVAFADLFKQYSSDDVQIAISVPNVATVKEALAAVDAPESEITGARVSQGKILFGVGSIPSKYGPHPSQEGLRPLYDRIAWARQAPEGLKIKDIFVLMDQKHGDKPKEAITFGMVLENDAVIIQDAPVMGGISAGEAEPGTHENIAAAIKFFEENVRERFIGLNVGTPDEIEDMIVKIDEEFRAKAENKDKPTYSYIGGELSIGISMMATIALAEMLHVPPEVVINYDYNEEGLKSGMLKEPQPITIPVNFGVDWEGGKHGVAKSLPDLVKEGIIKDDSRFPARFKEAPNDKENQLAMVPPQELQKMVFAPTWQQAHDIGIKLTKKYQELLNKKYGIKTRGGAESGATTDQLRDKNGRLITLELVLDILDEAVESLPKEEAKYVRYALDIAASEMYIPEIDMYYIGPDAARTVDPENKDGLVNNPQFTQYKLNLFKKYWRFISCEDWADENMIKHWEDQKLIIKNRMIAMGDDFDVSRPDLIEKYTLAGLQNAHLEKENQSGSKRVAYKAILMSHYHKNVVVTSHRGTRSAQEKFTAWLAMGTGTFGAKWTLWGVGRGALIEAMNQLEKLFRKGGAFENVKLAYQGAMVLDPNDFYEDYPFAQRIREEISASSAMEIKKQQAALKQISKTTSSKVIYLVLDGLGGVPVDGNRDKKVLLELDGLGGLPAVEGKTELEIAKTPNLDALVRKSDTGLVNVMDTLGIIPGSGPGHFAIFGYDAYEGTGRGILDALGAEVQIKPGDIVARGNLATLSDGVISDRRAGRIATSKTQEIVKEYLSDIEIDGVKFIFYSTAEHRLALVIRGKDISLPIGDSDPGKEGLAPVMFSGDSAQAKRLAELMNKLTQEANRRLSSNTVDSKANAVVFRGFDVLEKIPSLHELYKLNPAAICTYPAYKGIAENMGMEILPVSGSGTLEDQVKVLEQSAKDHDFIYFHVKTTDKYGEDGNLAAKVHVIEEVDKLIPRILALMDLERGDTLVVLGDHSTPAAMKSHSDHSVPIAVYTKYTRPTKDVSRFTEEEVRKGSLGRIRGSDVMPLALGRSGKLGTVDGPIYGLSSSSPVVNLVMEKLEDTEGGVSLKLGYWVDNKAISVPESIVEFAQQEFKSYQGKYPGIAAEIALGMIDGDSQALVLDINIKYKDAGIANEVARELYRKCGEKVKELASLAIDSKGKKELTKAEENFITRFVNMIQDLKKANLKDRTEHASIKFTKKDGRLAIDCRRLNDQTSEWAGRLYGLTWSAEDDLKMSVYRYGKNRFNNDSHFTFYPSKKVFEAIKSRSEAATADLQSQASSAMKAPGGIDFRAPALTIKYQPMGNFAGLNPKLPVLSKAELAVFNIDQELSGMERLVDNQMIPSGDRLKEVLAACSQKGELTANKERLLALLVKIGIAEETQCCLQEASKEYKEALVLADSLA